MTELGALIGSMTLSLIIGGDSVRMVLPSPPTTVVSCIFVSIILSWARRRVIRHNPTAGLVSRVINCGLPSFFIVGSQVESHPGYKRWLYANCMSMTRSSQAGAGLQSGAVKSCGCLRFIWSQRTRGSNHILICDCTHPASCQSREYPRAACNRPMNCTPSHPIQM